MDPKPCPICQKHNLIPSDLGGDLFAFTCPICGMYRMTGLRWAVFNDSFHELRVTRGEFSGFTRLNFERGHIITISDESWKELIQNPFIPKRNDIERKVDLLLDFVKRKTEFFGSLVNLHPEQDFSLVFSDRQEELHSYIKLLGDQRLIGGPHPGSLRFFLTAEGFKRAESVEETRTIFIATPIDPDSKERVGLISAMKDAIANCGFNPSCADEDHGKMIVEFALPEIRRSRFVIVDTTDNKASVAFEAGYAYNLGKEMIFVRKKSEAKREFYSGHYKVHDYESPEELREVLERIIRARAS